MQDMSHKLCFSRFDVSASSWHLTPPAGVKDTAACPPARPCNPAPSLMTSCAAPSPPPSRRFRPCRAPFMHLSRFSPFRAAERGRLPADARFVPALGRIIQFQPGTLASSHPSRSRVFSGCSLETCSPTSLNLLGKVLALVCGSGYAESAARKLPVEHR